MQSKSTTTASHSSLQIPTVAAAGGSSSGGVPAMPLFLQRLLQRAEAWPPSEPAASAASNKTQQDHLEPSIELTDSHPPSQNTATVAGTTTTATAAPQLNASGTLNVAAMTAAGAEAAVVLVDNLAAKQLAAQPIAPPRAITVFRLAVYVYVYASGGPSGLEDLVLNGSGVIAFTALLLGPVILALPQALITAELGAMMPSQAGAVVWVVRAFGPYAGFYFGWVHAFLYAANIAAVTAVASAQIRWLANPGVGSEAQTWDIPVRIAIVATAAIAGMLTLNQVAKLALPAFALVILMQVVGFCAAADRFSEDMWTRSNPAGAVDWAVVLTNVLWQYSGLASSSPTAGEVVSRTTLFGGLFSAVGLMIVSMVMAMLMMLAESTSFGDVSRQAPYLLTSYYRAIPDLGFVFGLVMFAATITAVITTIANDSRNLWALARLGWAPKPLRWQRRSNGAPLVAAAALSLLSVPFVALSLNEIVKALYTTATVAMALIPLAALKLRVSQPDVERVCPIPFGVRGVAFLAVVQVLALGTVFVVGMRELWVAVVVISVNAFLLGTLAIFRRYLMAELKSQAKKLKEPLTQAQQALMQATAQAVGGDDDGGGGGTMAGGSATADHHPAAEGPTASFAAAARTQSLGSCYFDLTIALQRSFGGSAFQALGENEVPKFLANISALNAVTLLHHTWSGPMGAAAATITGATISTSFAINIIPPTSTSAEQAAAAAAGPPSQDQPQQQERPVSVNSIQQQALALGDSMNHTSRFNATHNVAMRVPAISGISTAAILANEGLLYGAPFAAAAPSSAPDPQTRLQSKQHKYDATQPRTDLEDPLLAAPVGAAGDPLSFSSSTEKGATGHQQQRVRHRRRVTAEPPAAAVAAAAANDRGSHSGSLLLRGTGHAASSAAAAPPLSEVRFTAAAAAYDHDRAMLSDSTAAADDGRASQQQQGSQRHELSGSGPATPLIPTSSRFRPLSPQDDQ